MTSFSVILVEPKYGGNIGSVARAMKNFGFKDLVLVSPPKLEGEARAMAMHGRDILDDARVFSDFDSATQGFDFLAATSAIVATDKNVLRTPVSPERLSLAFETDAKVGLVFGREDYGLFNEEIEACDLLVSIPSHSEYPTLNLSHSVAIILYELSRHALQEHREAMKKFKKADLVEKKVLLEKYDEFVDLVHRKEQDAKLAKKTFRQLVGRAFISGRESFTLIGLFRRASKKIRR